MIVPALTGFVAATVGVSPSLCGVAVAPVLCGAALLVFGREPNVPDL